VRSNIDTHPHASKCRSRARIDRERGAQRETPPRSTVT